MKKSVLLSVLAVVLVAGCTGGQIPFITATTTFIGGNGLTITEFSIDPTEIYGGANARIVMEVENKGGTPVVDTDMLVLLKGSALDLDGDDTMYWTESESGESVVMRLDSGEELKPEDPVRETPADTERFTWRLAAPDISAGEQRDDIFIARVYYDYSTKVSGTIWVYSQAEADAARAAGRPLNQPTFTSTSGPVALTVKPSPNVVVLDTGEDDFVLTIKVSSVGGGTLYEAGSVNYAAVVDDVAIPEGDLNLVDISVDSTLVATDCDVQEELVGGKDVTISCDVTVPSAPSTFTGYPITITADYGYYTEKTASVSVSGR
jgi:hypothetical protein